MKKEDAIKLFAHCACDSELFAVAQETAKRLETSKTVRIVMGKPQDSRVLFGIYSARLKRKRDRNERIAGLEETVLMFAKNSGIVQGGYAETDIGLVYFWTNETGDLVGCVLQTQPTTTTGAHAR